MRSYAVFQIILPHRGEEKEIYPVKKTERSKQCRKRRSNEQEVSLCLQLDIKLYIKINVIVTNAVT